MRVNIYAEEMTDRVELVEKNGFVGLRIYLYMPVTQKLVDIGEGNSVEQLRGPFLHHDGDDDSSAVTFWGKADLRVVLEKALNKLDAFYEERQEHENRN